MYDETLSRALIAYAGQPGRLDERSPEARVAVEISDAAALEVLPLVREIVHAMYVADPPLYNVATEADLLRSASAWIRLNHPEVSPAATRATANRFAYEWR